MGKLWLNERQFVEFADGTPVNLTAEIATRSEIGQIFTALYNILPNPDPVLRKTSQGIEILREIKRDPHVSSCTVSRKNGVLKRKWMLYSDEAKSSTVELLEQAFKDMKIYNVISEILQAWGYGYSVLEILWERQGNYLLPGKIIGKPQEWFSFDQENKLRRKTKNTSETVEIEPHKFLLAQYESDYMNPYGEAQFSLCFWPVTFKKGGLKFWAKFLEKFGMPHAIGKLPPNAASQERRNLLDALSKMIQNAVAVIPDNASIELLEAVAKGSSNDIFKSFAEYHDADISKVILGHMSSTTATPGKLGGDNTALDVRDDIIDGDCRLIESVFDELIEWIIDLNPTLGPERPAFMLYQEEDVDTALADRDKKLSETGQVKFTKKYLKKAYDFEDDDIEVVTTPASEPQQIQTGKAAIMAANTPTVTPDKPRSIAELDAIIERCVKEATFDGSIDVILNMVKEASTLEDLRDRIIDAYRDLDIKALTSTLAQAMMAAELSGRFEVTKEVENR